MAVRGVDVHGAKGAIDWRRVREAGFEFALLKTSEGRTFDDERFAFNRAAAKAAGLVVGGYHFARPDNNTAAEEAAHLLRIYRPKPGELRPALDWEQNPPTAAWALEFLGKVEAAIGAPPILYSFPDFLRRTGSHHALSRFPLWYARFGANDGNVHPAQPPSPLKVAIHQFTSRGRVPGISGNVDLNVLKLDSLAPLLHGAHKETRDVPDDALEGADTNAEPPPNPEGEGTAGSWGETGERETLEREDLE